MSDVQLCVSSTQRREGDALAMKLFQRGNYMSLVTRMFGIVNTISTRGATLSSEEWSELAQETAVHFATLVAITDQIELREKREKK